MTKVIKSWLTGKLNLKEWKVDFAYMKAFCLVIPLRCQHMRRVDKSQKKLIDSQSQSGVVESWFIFLWSLLLLNSISWLMSKFDTRSWFSTTLLVNQHFATLVNFFWKSTFKWNSKTGSFPDKEINFLLLHFNFACQSTSYNSCHQ